MICFTLTHRTFLDFLFIGCFLVDMKKNQQHFSSIFIKFHTISKFLNIPEKFRHMDLLMMLHHMIPPHKPLIAKWTRVGLHSTMLRIHMSSQIDTVHIRTWANFTAPRFLITGVFSRVQFQRLFRLKFLSTFLAFQGVIVEMLGWQVLLEIAGGGEFFGAKFTVETVGCSQLGVSD